MTSQARIDSNRKNAQQSTGPRTAEGKERTRLNGLKHGLRSEEVVLPTESREEFESFMAAWMDDWKPPTETRRFLVERAATAAWRLKRCVRNEKVRVEARINTAAAEWDKAHAQRIESAVRWFNDEPSQSMTSLTSCRRGLNALAGIALGMIDALNDPEGWSELHHNRLCHLLGITGEDDPEHLEQVSRASFGLFLRQDSTLANEYRMPLDDAMAAWVGPMLRDLLVAKIEEYQARFNAMPLYPASRGVHLDRKAAEAHPEDAIHHRYEGRLDREVRATIAQLTRLQQTGADLMAGDESEAPSEPKETVAEAPSEPKGPTPEPQAPSEPNPVPAQGLITKVDRDPKGASGAVAGVVGAVPMVGVPLSNR